MNFTDSAKKEDRKAGKEEWKKQNLCPPVCLDSVSRVVVCKPFV